MIILKTLVILVAIVVITYGITKVKHDIDHMKYMRIASIAFWSCIIASAISGYAQLALIGTLLTCQLTGMYLNATMHIQGRLDLRDIVYTGLYTIEYVTIALAIVMNSWLLILITYSAIEMIRLISGIRLEVGD